MNPARVLLALAFVSVACTAKSSPPPATEDHEAPPQIEPEQALLEPGILLAVEWDTGISGAGISDRMFIGDDGVVSYLATVRKDTKVHHARLTPEDETRLRATIASPEFAAIESEFLPPNQVHDAGLDRLVVQTPAGPREIVYNDRYAELPPPLKDVLAIVDAVHLHFADVNPWNAEW